MAAPVPLSGDAQRPLRRRITRGEWVRLDLIGCSRREIVLMLFEELTRTDDLALLLGRAALEQHVLAQDDAERAGEVAESSEPERSKRV